MYTGQFVYCGHRTTLSIGNVPPLRGIFEGTVICNVEHRTGECGAPSPRRSGTMPSSSAPTTALGQEALPAKGRPQQTTTRSTTLGTLQCPSSIGGGGAPAARAARTISSTWDDLLLNIALRIHKQIQI
ncbi:uncharacterized protein [Miscanthus floridulus]|uniref:uncharacterized protein n=1 Tax=Miscanthus floridulus TaxID=154761 RepID=UPI003458AD46